MRVTLPDNSVRILEHQRVLIEELLQDLGISPPEVLVSRNGTLVCEGTVIAAEDEIRIYRISHGG